VVGSDGSGRLDGAVAEVAPPDLHGVIETALARALVLAAEGQRWELVAQIANVLAARRDGRTDRVPMVDRVVVADRFG
jgi:hypothetical protein